MTAIETSGLTKRYGELVAVEDLDLTVERGEIYGFLGPNGAGKSTTINLLLDFLHPTSGEVRLFGRDPREAFPELRRRIGILPEDATPYDRLTGREHVAFTKACKDADTDVDTILDRVGLDPTDADRPAGAYSTGMAQRLGLGMALVGDPDLLILDEPSSGLDPNGMREMRAILREEADDGTAVFFSSHVLAEVDSVCDRAGILDDGRLVVQDTVESLRESVFTACRVEVTVRTIPDGEFGLADVDGVENVERDESTLRVTCANPSVKASVVAHLHDRTTVTDLVSEPASIEETFEAYTADEAADGATTTTADAAMAGEEVRT
ncbi:ABC transporter ATP-binding protein [Halorussus aquaticus]|uniref:ABC transporter ATP-binding protein n=1 Tax=Halorussus aquaticus TaxID=2953748 RepID=A0ABD5Q779_9EURY|nr:ABC transporter ATP-binding protein [Halorussus aquaticus]